MYSRLLGHQIWYLLCHRPCVSLGWLTRRAEDTARKGPLSLKEDGVYRLTTAKYKADRKPRVSRWRRTWSRVGKRSIVGRCSSVSNRLAEYRLLTSGTVFEFRGRVPLFLARRRGRPGVREGVALQFCHRSREGPGSSAVFNRSVEPSPKTSQFNLIP